MPTPRGNRLGPLVLASFLLSPAAPTLLSQSLVNHSSVNHSSPSHSSSVRRVHVLDGKNDVEIEVEGESRELPEEVQQHLLRIAQEAVTNTVKHSHAGQVQVHLAFEPRGVRLIVADDGQGFEPREAFSEGGGHFGLLGMRERAERLGGELGLDSAPGQGTRVTVTAPLAGSRGQTSAMPETVVTER